MQPLETKIPGKKPARKTLLKALPKRLEEYFRDKKIVLSERKKAVLLVLLSNPDFMDAEEIYFWIITAQLTRISMASVYIALNWLVELGMAEKAKKEDRNFLFRLIPS